MQDPRRQDQCYIIGNAIEGRYVVRKDTDYKAIERGEVSITFHCDLTHYGALKVSEQVLRMTPSTRKIRLILDLRRRGITNTDLLSAFERVPREDFVPDAFLDQCYEDIAPHRLWPNRKPTERRCEDAPSSRD